MSSRITVNHVEQPSLHVQLGTTMALRAAPPTSPQPGQLHASSGQYDVVHHGGAQSPGFFGNQQSAHYSGQSNGLYVGQPTGQPAGFFGGQQGGQPHSGGASDIYGPLPSFSMPLSTSSNININLPSQQQPQHLPTAVRGPDICATHIPINYQMSQSSQAAMTSPMLVTSPPAHHVTSNVGIQTPPQMVTSQLQTEAQPSRSLENQGTQVALGPPTRPKPQRMRNGSTQSSNGSSSGIGSTPSSPRMAPSNDVAIGTTDASVALSRMKLDRDADVESLTWSSLDDTRSEGSFRSSGGGSGHGGGHDGLECDSACSVGSPEGEEKEEIPTYDRVGVVSDEKIAVMVQLTCESDEGTANEKFTDLVAGVAKACAQYFRKKEAEKETMNATQIGQIIMADRRPVKEHVTEVSQAIGENIIINRADCRRVNGKGFVGSYVTENVVYKERTAVAKNGVIVVLRKLNKFACCKEFSEQLCLHVLAARPESLGKGELSAVVERSVRKKPINPKCLLTQRFYCDQTCNVYEAGKRSFVEVVDFVLY